MSETLNYWLLMPQLWLILGVLFVIAEVVLGGGYVLLSFGISSLLVAILNFVQARTQIVVVTDWMDIGLVFAVLTVCTIFLMRRLFVGSVPDNDDINQY
tara:strand:- start:168 stop:464 length:297 start_codon:yes stop_codon:yes gene_type:complete